MRFTLAKLLASGCPNAWHDAIADGTLDGGIIEVPDQVGSELISRCGLTPESTPSRPIGPRQISPPTANLLSEEAILQRRAACDGCAWHIDGICEHSGCKPCQQRATGGLAAKIATPSATCPAGKW